MFLLCCDLARGQNKFRNDLSNFDRLLKTDNSSYTGEDQQGGFWCGHHYFRNLYDTGYKVWSGFAVSSMKDTLTGDYTNDLSAITGSGIMGSNGYLVCFSEGVILPENPKKFLGFYATNTTYAYKSILNGSSFSKKFGGTSGNDKDWFRIKISGFYNGKVSDSLYFYLADYTNDDPVKDYIIKDWTWVDLTLLGLVDSLKFTFESTDVGQFGMNTPAYIAIDDFNGLNATSISVWPGILFDDDSAYKTGDHYTALTDTNGGFVYDNLYFENSWNKSDSSWSGWALSRDFDSTKTGMEGALSCMAAMDAFNFNGSTGFAVSKGRSAIRFPYRKGGWALTNFRLAITNNALAYKSMKYGDGKSKKFGGPDGKDEDYFRIRIIGYNENNVPVDTIEKDSYDDELVLADYRNGSKYISNSWSYIFTDGFKKNICKLEFQLESTDYDSGGMLTPPYFCLDNFLQVPIESTGKRIQHKVLIYPNPVQDNFRYQFYSGLPELVEIYDGRGALLEQINAPENNVISMSNYVPGTYFIKVYQNRKIGFGRILKH